MYIRPIPKKILIHTVTYHPFIKGDGITTDDSYGEPVTLFHVRVESTSNTTVSNLIRTSTSEEVNYNFNLFYDVRNSSSSASFTFNEKDKVEFEGKELVVDKVDAYSTDRLHHYKVSLS